jgi:hypothetical protein
VDHQLVLLVVSPINERASIDQIKTGLGSAINQIVVESPSLLYELMFTCIRASSAKR